MVLKADKGTAIIITNNELHKQKTINSKHMKRTQRKNTINKYNTFYKNVIRSLVKNTGNT
jgi:hypothetical protein